MNNKAEDNGQEQDHRDKGREGRDSGEMGYKKPDAEAGKGATKGEDMGRAADKEEQGEERDGGKGHRKITGVTVSLHCKNQ